MALNRRTAIIGIIIAAVVIPIGIYTISPLFFSKTVNEPEPIFDKSSGSGAFQKFMDMSEQERFEKGQKMTADQKESIMKEAASTDGTSVNEAMAEIMASDQASTTLSGVFVGVNDGIHNAEGNVKVITLADGTGTVLRLEDFKSTNGPDLYVYLSTDKSASDFINLGRLKGNIGNQNYDVPNGTDFSRYDMVLIWCKAFSVLFGDAKLNPVQPI